MEERKLFSFDKRIGKTRYNVNVYQIPEGTETFEDKLHKLIRIEMMEYFSPSLNGVHNHAEIKEDTNNEN